MDEHAAAATPCGLAAELPRQSKINGEKRSWRNERSKQGGVEERGRGMEEARKLLCQKWQGDARSSYPRQDGSSMSLPLVLGSLQHPHLLPLRQHLRLRPSGQRAPAPELFFKIIFINKKL